VSLRSCMLWICGVAYFIINYFVLVGPDPWAGQGGAGGGM